MSVPKLRFEEFLVKWEHKTVADLVDNFGGTALEEFVSNNGTHNFISIGNYLKTGHYFDNGQRVPLNEKTRLKLLNQNDLVMVLNDKTQAGDLIGATILISENKKFVYNQRSERLVCKNAHPKFMWHLLNSQKIRKKIFSISQGGTQIYVNFPAVKKIEIFIPNIEEQQKIADFLSAVDEKITALTAQKTALTHYKQGMMQRIFSQTLRFKDDNGADYPEWDRTSLSQLGTTYGGLTGKTKEDFGIGKPFITYKQVFDDSKIDISRFEHVQISKDETQNRVKRGDIIFTTSSETANEIAFSSVLLDEFDELYLNSFCFGYRPNSLETFLPEYARYLFRSEFLRKEIIMLAQGSTRYNISKNQLMKLHIPLPSMPEQTKIAQFLTELDDKINAVDAQIQSAQQWKQGLLQQMFV